MMMSLRCDQEVMKHAGEEGRWVNFRGYEIMINEHGNKKSENSAAQI